MSAAYEYCQIYVDFQTNVVPNMKMKLKAKQLENFLIGHSEET
jgi:hypothetical protein